MNTQNFPKWFLDKRAGFDIINREKIFLPEYLEKRVKKIDDLINDSKKIADFFIDNNVFEKEFFPDGVDIQVESSFEELRVCFKSKINDKKRSWYRYDIGPVLYKEKLSYLLLLKQDELEWEFERARRWIIFFTLFDMRMKKKISKERIPELFKLSGLDKDNELLMRFDGLERILDNEFLESIEESDSSATQEEADRQKNRDLEIRSLKRRRYPRRADCLRDYIDLDDSIEKLI